MRTSFRNITSKIPAQHACKRSYNEETVVYQLSCFEDQLEYPTLFDRYERKSLCDLRPYSRTLQSSL